MIYFYLVPARYNYYQTSSCFEYMGIAKRCNLLLIFELKLETIKGIVLIQFQNVR
jgi:hypothetical protein